MAREVAQLWPLHEAAAPFYQLPEEGVVTIGRRTDCTVVISDDAVSGLHCVLRYLCKEPLSFEVEDRSTNGISINDVRVAKGDSVKFTHGDVLALGKVAEEYGGAATAVRPQFRLHVLRADRSLELLGQPSAASRDLRGDPSIEGGSGVLERSSAPASLENQPAKPCFMSSGTSTAEGFAQDLLMQEQKSKAKITGELLLVQRQVDEKRTAREVLDRELRKARAILADERARRASAQEGLERLQAESKQSQQEHQQLQELREEHTALERKHDSMEAERNVLLASLTTLEASQGKACMDIQRASSDDERVRSQLAEAQARLQQANERTESLQKRHLDSRNAAEAAQELVEKLKRELSAERGLREQLEDEVTLLRADSDNHWHGHSAAKEALATAEAQQGELQAQITKNGDEAASLRQRAKGVRENVAYDSQEVEELRGAGGRFVEALRAFGDAWFQGLSEGTHPPRALRLSGPLVDKVALDGQMAANGSRSPARDVKSIVSVEESSRMEVNAASTTSSIAAAVVEGGAPADVALQENRAAACVPPQIEPSAVSAGGSESARPPVPLWEGSADVGKAADPGLNLPGGLGGQRHGMASLMVSSQDSPPLTAQTAEEDAQPAEPVWADVPRPLKMETQVPGPTLDAAAMQRMASTSVLTLVTPPPKRPMQLPQSSAARKRLRAR